MTDAAELIIDTPDVRSELRALCISLEIVHTALENGYVQRSLCTENSPIQTAGTESWRGTIESLRDLTVRPGSEWRRADIDGLPVIANDKHKLVLAVTTGDYNTGLRHKKPKTKNKKGVVIKMATVENGGTADMFGHVPERQTVFDFHDYEFWLLLIHTKNEVVYSEFSRPSVFSSHAEKVVGWSKRIIIPPVVPGETLEDMDDAPADDDFDFDLKKKS